MKFSGDDDLIKNQKIKMQRQYENLLMSKERLELIKQQQEDEQAKLQELMENEFDPSNMNMIEQYDGFILYKHKQTSSRLVKRYCYNLEQDYVEYKYMVCAYTQGLDKYIVN